MATVIVKSDSGDVDICSVVGHAIVLVVKGPNDFLDVERIIGVNADSAEDNQIVGDFIRKVEAQLAEIFEPEVEPAPKIWTPNE